MTIPDSSEVLIPILRMMLDAEGFATTLKFHPESVEINCLVVYAMHDTAPTPMLLEMRIQVRDGRYVGVVDVDGTAVFATAGATAVVRMVRRWFGSWGDPMAIKEKPVLHEPRTNMTGGPIPPTGQAGFPRPPRR